MGPSSKKSQRNLKTISKFSQDFLPPEALFFWHKSGASARENSAFFLGSQEVEQNLAGQATLSLQWAVVAQFRAETAVEQARFKERLNVSRMFELDRGKSPVGLVRARTPFVGRRQQLDWLECCLAETLAGNPRAVLIQGEAGIGKTRLLKELRSIVLRYGGHVCYGRCYEDLTLPYLPFVESFLAYLEQVPEAVQRTLGPHLELINGLLRRTETAAPLASTALSTQPSQDTLRLFLAVSR